MNALASSNFAEEPAPDSGRAWLRLAATMLVATRISARLLWLTGAALLVVVVIKLFLVDLSSIGTIERIVSFIGVGLLMLVIGYFSPLPPDAKES